MKTLLLAFLALLSAACFADQPTPEQLASAPVVSLLDLGVKGSGSVDGQVVKLQFGWREGDMLVASNGKPRGKGNVTSKKRVVVPDDARARQWFTSLPTRENSPSTQTAIVKFNVGALAEVIGRDARNGQPVW